MKTMWQGIKLILSMDSCGLLKSVQLEDSAQDITMILSCNCLAHCSKIANQKYMTDNVEAYR